MSQVAHTFIVDSIWLKIFFSLEIMVSCMATFYTPQVAHANEKLALELSLDLTLGQHFHDEEPESRKVHAHFEVDPPRA
jgi:hypothetical protein